MSMSQAMPEILKPAGVASSGFQKAEFSLLRIILSTFRTFHIVFLVTNGFYGSRIPCTHVHFHCTQCGKVKSSALLFNLTPNHVIYPNPNNPNPTDPKLLTLSPLALTLIP